jgi:hypothetical protein
MSSPATHVALPRLGVLLVAAALGAAACTGSATTGTTPPTAVAQATAAATTSPAVTAAPTTAPTASAAPSSGSATSGASDGPTAVPTSIDPCQLIPAAEAGKLAGATFGPGTEKALSGNGRMCTYGANTKNVFEVIVAVAPDVATAQKAEASTLAEIEANAAQISQGINITKLPGFAPGVDAVLDQLKPNSIGVAGIGMNLLKGTVFVGFNDLVLGGAAPSADAMKAEAMTILGRLP